MENESGPEPVAVRPASRALAIGAFLALITSLLVPWWGVQVVSELDGQSFTDEDEVRTFRPDPPLTTTWGPILTGLLVVVASGILFVRIAARSDRHEPPAWRRDVGLAAGACAAALVSASLWPDAAATFWGGAIYDAASASDPSVTETAAPLLGWWLVVLALVLLGFASLAARPKTDT